MCQPLEDIHHLARGGRGDFVDELAPYQRALRVELIGQPLNLNFCFFCAQQQQSSNTV